MIFRIVSYYIFTWYTLCDIHVCQRFEGYCSFFAKHPKVNKCSYRLISRSSVRVILKFLSKDI